ncbi:MAG: hypothetical protein QHH04_03140 [Methanolinea sp.]|nr:hypothetical protein [Methanolinea sp.]
MGEGHEEGGMEQGGMMPAFCVCPMCGYRIRRHATVPCYTMSCPRCETQMVPG